MITTKIMEIETTVKGRLPRMHDGVILDVGENIKIIIGKKEYIIKKVDIINEIGERKEEAV